MMKNLSGKLLSLLLCLTLVLAYSCDEDDDDSTTPSGTSGTKSGVCGTAYSHISDAQLDAYCGMAYAYRCLDGKPASDPGVQAVCTYYKQLKTSSAPNCPYCN